MTGTDLSTELDEQDTLITNQDVVIEDIVEALEHKIAGTDLSTELDEQNTLLATQEVKIDDILLAIHNKGMSGANTSDATATADDILLGKTAYVNEGKLGND